MANLGAGRPQLPGALPCLQLRLPHRPDHGQLISTAQPAHRTRSLDASALADHRCASAAVNGPPSSVPGVRASRPVILTDEVQRQASYTRASPATSKGCELNSRR